jgi:uncharacterized SAM-binding protein YcdF (DUF218 family)
LKHKEVMGEHTGAVEKPKTIRAATRVQFLSRAAIRVLALIGLLFVVTTATPVACWWTKLLARPWDGRGGEYLVVLGSSMVDESIMGYSSYWRAVYAAREWRTGNYRGVLISGGATVEGQKPVAQAMAEFLAGNGVPRSVIRLETKSGNTHENAEACARLLREIPGEKVLLTSDYHAYRAYRSFERAGLRVHCHPVPDAAKRYSSSWLLRPAAVADLALESGKVVYYWWKGWI